MLKQQNIMQRQTISLVKIKILNCIKGGESPTSFGRTFGLKEETIRTFRKNVNSIRQTIISGSKLSSKAYSYSRNHTLAKTENLFFLDRGLTEEKNI